MNRLINANFVRLFKSLIFKLAMAFSIGLGIFCVLMRYIDIKKNADAYARLGESRFTSVDGLIFVGGMYLIFAAAVLVGIFVGTEYSDGTIRNKIVVGRTRPSIYISNLITCVVANLIIHLSYIVTVLILGNIILTPTDLSIKQILLLTFLSCLAMIAITAIFLLLSMLIQSKAVASVVILIVTIVLFCTSLTIDNKLRQPEYYDSYSITNEEEETTEFIKEKNPNYLTGTKLKVYEFLNDFIPSSQIYQVAMEESDKAGQKAGYSCIILLITTGIGILVFRKKDLK
ncbi:MAG: ABC transporter permease subunit [Ruminococcus sp.]|nr:ABC transporter permease subunit [Ruminococcus sp.]